jgi:predicted porin
MKKTLIALAAVAATGAAFAQSSVTLYGVADVAVGKVTTAAGAGSNTISATLMVLAWLATSSKPLLPTR